MVAAVLRVRIIPNTVPYHRDELERTEHQVLYRGVYTFYNYFLKSDFVTT